MSETASMSRSRFLDLRALAGLEHLRFTTRHRIEGAYSGRHLSKTQGGAGEFADFREYTEGEDLRRLDWKVLSRTGRAYVRLYQDETDLMCTLVLDASSSMAFAGDPRKNKATSKLEYMQYLATALSHMISRQKDQVGFALVDEDVRSFLPPGATTTHVKQIQEQIERMDTRPATKMGGALRAVYQRMSRRGVLILMSDFLDDDLDDVFSALRLFRHQYWEVVVLHIVHPDEERLPEGLAYRFAGLEGEGVMNCTPGDIREEYAKRFDAHCAMVRTASMAAGCDYRRVSTAIPYLQTLASFLVERVG
jgi:uncharacterized protein (DUF58 family)